MGNSRPPKAAEISLVDSYARRAGQRAELVLADPRIDLPADPTVLLRHRKDRTELEAGAELVEDERGRRLLVSVPLSGLADGIWAVRLRTADGESGLGCRLLVQGDRPLVLLWGAKGLPSMLPKPHPRSTGPKEVAVRARSAAGRVRRAVSRRARRSA